MADVGDEFGVCFVTADPVTSVTVTEESRVYLGQFALSVPWSEPPRQHVSFSRVCCRVAEVPS